jgi:hypothetical protein
MFIPLHDANGLEHIRFQYVTVGLIIANVLIFFATVLGVSEEVSNASVFGLGYIPAVMNDIAEMAPADILVPENFTYITYAFLHADIFHLGGNMLFHENPRAREAGGRLQREDPREGRTVGRRARQREDVDEPVRRDRRRGGAAPEGSRQGRGSRRRLDRPGQGAGNHAHRARHGRRPRHPGQDRRAR